MKIEVSYKRISADIKFFFVENDMFFILIGSRLWIFDYAGRHFPDVDTHNIDVCEMKVRGKLLFLLTSTCEVFTCRLGCSTLSKIPVLFSAISIGKHTLYVHGKSLFMFADPAGMLSKHICSFDDKVDDVLYSNRRVFVIVAGSILFAHWDPMIKTDASSFRSIGFLSGIPCRRLHTNSLRVVIVETDSYIVSLFPKAPVLIRKPSTYYDFSFTKHHVVFLAESILIVSLFSGSVEKIVRLTGFKSVFDAKTGKLWVYSNSLFEIKIEESSDEISEHLAGQHMFKLAMRISRRSPNVIEKYVKHLFEKKQPEKALRYFRLLGKPFYFCGRQLLENAQKRTGMSSVVFSCKFAKNVRVPEHVFLGFLFQKAVSDGEYIEFLSKILFMRKKFGLFKKLAKALFAKNIKIEHIEDIDYASCPPDEKKAVDEYNLHHNPAKLVQQKLFAKKHASAKRVFTWAYRNHRIKNEECKNFESLLLHVRSKSVTQAFVKALGHECLSIMQRNEAYINLVYYIRFYENILEDMQQIFRTVALLPAAMHKKILVALERKFSSRDCLEPLLHTFRFIVSQDRTSQDRPKL